MGLSLPVFVALIVLSMAHYWREYELIQEQTRLTAVNLGDVLYSSLAHTMLIKDDDHLARVLSDISRLENVDRVQIIGASGWNIGSADLSGQFDLLDEECQACHQYPAGQRPRTVEFGKTSKLLRVSTPIDNRPECFDCHDAANVHLGVLLIDVPMGEFQAHLLEDLQIDLLISALATFLVALGVNWLVNRLIVSRIETLQKPMVAFAAGDHSARIQKRSTINDEICELASTFNEMADRIEQHTLDQEERTKVRQRAIVEERERIARELHDGISQVLGYVNTKAMAVRMLLQKERWTDADQQLLQLEEAARGLFMDVREAILGLRMSGRVDADLALTIRDYVERFNQLSDFHVQLDLSKPGELKLDPETVLQLLRIVQEALTNARKYSLASVIEVRLHFNQDALQLEVRDNGIGFNPEAMMAKENGRFGLRTMQERAEEIGANIDIQSQPGVGTQVIVNLMVGRKQETGDASDRSR